VHNTNIIKIVPISSPIVSELRSNIFKVANMSLSFMRTSSIFAAHRMPNQVSLLNNSAFAHPLLSSTIVIHHQNHNDRYYSSRSRRGLYDGKDVRSGNKVSFSMRKTKRKFKPNVFKKRLYSEILNEKIQFKVTTSAMKTIEKFGGLDEYLLKSPHIYPEGVGWIAKQKILDKMNDYKEKGEDVLGKIIIPSRVIVNTKAQDDEAHIS